MKLASALFLCLLLAGCANKTPGNASKPSHSKPVSEANYATNTVTFPSLGSVKKLQAGVLFYEVILPRKQPTKLWVYLPEHPTRKKLPCVMIAPAGSRLIDGMNLAASDQAEHLPYVRAGFAVVAYEIDGALSNNASDQETIEAIKAYQAAEAGLVNARLAIDYVFAKIPQIDTKQLYTAGHSSAATLSLLVAEHEPRVRASIAYAPATNVVDRLGEPFITSMSKLIPDFREFITRSSPHTELQKLTHPLFIFQAEDDSVIPISKNLDFIERVKKVNSSVTFVHVKKGDHYDAMIQKGIPQAIQWLKNLK
ncbi:MAG: prolyl oligopeptidase family serine peptidase [Lyngbya sp. HA4199-MV5]|jgi:dipeptidyl aminopeptidase/acylaminoacyl peptidase|nr:prolyl oligopeptidase family serine peptidase [Lyngbya sp. HA4199-MV5]